MDVDSNPTEIHVTATVSAPLVTESTSHVTAEIASSSGAVRDEPFSSSGKRPEEPFEMPFVDDSSDDDEFISIRELKRRIVVLEQDTIHKDTNLIQLEDTIVQKNQQIDQLQGDVGLLFNMVYDLRGKIEKKFGDEFIDPTDTKRRRKAEEDRARVVAKNEAERAAAMDHYFKKVTSKEADKEKAKRLKQKREYVVLKNKNPNPAKEDVQVTHHLMDVGENYYDKVRNRSGIIRWGFDHDRHRWWIKRKVGPVELYKNPAQFQTFTKVDFSILSKSPYVDDKPGGRGYLFSKDCRERWPMDFLQCTLLNPL
ncbi:hypothetical protein Hanom_Chr05g00403411 [Helianthus anomalus]